METTPFGTRSSLNPQEGLAMLVKAPAESPAQEVQPDGSSLFAGMLGQKISEVALLGSAPDSSTAAQGGKHPLPSGMMFGAKPQPGAGGKAKSATVHRPRLSSGNKGPMNGIKDETDPLAEPGEEISPSRTEKKEEPAEDTKTTLPSAKETMEHAIAMPVIGGNTPHSDPSPTENEAGQIGLRRVPDTALFAQAVQRQEAKRIERETDSSPAAKLAGKEPPAHASHEPLPLSGHLADHRSATEEGEHGTEQQLIRQAVDAPQPKNGGAATDAAPGPQQPGPAPYNSLKGTEDSKEEAPVAAVPRKPLSTDTALDLHQPGPSSHDHRKQVGESREGASTAAAPQKPFSPVRDGESAPERITPAGSPGKAIPAGDVIAEAPGAGHDHQQGRNTTANHAVKHSEHDIFPFRMDTLNTASPQGMNTPAAAGPTGIEMQAVIDQLLEARQSVGNDSGRIRILLNPPNLGAVDLDIVVRGERVDVVMTAENTTVQQALQSRGDDIRIALQRQDLKIEGFQVLLQDNGTSQQQTPGGAMYRQDREHRERFNASEDAQPVLPVLSPIAGMKAAAGRVSIFA